RPDIPMTAILPRDLAGIFTAELELDGISAGFAGASTIVSVIVVFLKEVELDSCSVGLAGESTMVCPVMLAGGAALSCAFAADTTVCAAASTTLCSTLDAGRA